MTSVNLHCPSCGLTAKRRLLEQVACRGVMETACEPASCPAGHGFMLRSDGVVQEFVQGEWVVTGWSDGVDRSRYHRDGPNGAKRHRNDYSPDVRLRVSIGDRGIHLPTRRRG